MLTKKMLIVSAMLAVGVLYGESIELKTTESWGSPKNIKSVGDGVLEATGRTSLISATIFKIDPTKTYKISGELRQTAGEKTRTYLGFMIFDEKKRNMSPLVFNCVRGTDTELVADLNPTDIILKVKDATKWNKPAKRFRIALNTSEDYSDLPNLSYISKEIIDIKKDGDVWVVTLEQPAQQTAKSGSKVRLHGDSGHVYTGGSHVTTAGDEWKKFSGSIKGYGKYGFSAYKAWPPGAIYARVIILGNWDSAKSPDVLQLKDVKVEVVD